MHRNFHSEKREKPPFAKGIHAVEEALISGKTIEKIFVLRGQRNEKIASIISAAQQRGIPCQSVPEEKMQRIGTAAQGIAAIISPVSFVHADDVIAQAYDRGESPLLIICDRITDVRNFGAIARTAFACGVHALIIPHAETAAINAEAIKASAGALLQISLCREKNLVNTVRALKLYGITIFAAAAAGSAFIYEQDFSAPAAIILGSEGEGISAPLLKIADQLIRIPMQRTFDSFNVSVAAGMILYEVMKQRMASSKS